MSESDLKSVDMIVALPESNNIRFFSVLDDLNDMLIQEKHQMDAGKFDNIRNFAMRKLRIYSQLRTSEPSTDLLGFDENQVAKVEHTRKLIDENATILKRRMLAINDITDAIGEALVESDSDGTYTIKKPLKGVLR